MNCTLRAPAFEELQATISTTPVQLASGKDGFKAAWFRNYSAVTVDVLVWNEAWGTPTEANFTSGKISFSLMAYETSPLISCQDSCTFWARAATGTGSIYTQLWS